MAVDVDGVESGDEVDEDVVYTLGHLFEERRRNLFVGWVFREVDGNQKLLGLGVDITNINTSFVCEQDPVTLDSESVLIGYRAVWKGCSEARALMHVLRDVIQAPDQERAQKTSAPALGIDPEL